MGPSEKSFRQVKDILGKLDRSIDELRNRRTTPASEAPEPVPSPINSLTLGAGSVPAVQPRLAGSAPSLPPPGSSPAPARKSNYGRATPLPPLAG